MPTFTLAITVDAPISRCFDLARSIDFHTHSMRSTGERAIAGTTTGLIGAGESVTWRARHLGLTHRLTSRIVAFDPPTCFIDEQIRGPFRSLRHEHRFDTLEAHTTRLTDTLAFRAPWGPLGRLAEPWLARHLRRLIRGHQRHLRQALESDDWRRFVADVPAAGPGRIS